MTQGITNSLNIMLSRMNAIENGFMALERISNQLNTVQPVNTSEGNDFKTILDAKIQEAQNKTDSLNELVDSSPLEIQTENQNEFQNEKSSSKEIEKAKEIINLKSKLDLQAQRANIEEIIETFSDQYNVDSDFIKAIIKQESGFDSNATSKKGAMGLMQLMPSTAKSLGVSDAYNPNQNIEGGIKYLKGLLDRFDNNKELALAAYNAGPNAVKKYGGVPPYKETQNYVTSIMSAYDKMKSTKGADI